MTTQTLYADSLTSGTVSTPANAYGAPDGTFTTDTTNTSWTARFSMGNPTNAQANGNHTFTLRVRKISSTANPLINSVAIYEGTTLRVTKYLSSVVGNTTGQDIIATLLESEIRTVTDLSQLQVQVATSGAGSGQSRTCVQLDSISWYGDFTAPPPPALFEGWGVPI